MSQFQEAVEATHREMGERDYESEAKLHRMKILRIPRTYLRATLADVPDHAPYLAKIVNWQSRFHQHVRVGEPYPGLFLYGPPGTGKSTLAGGMSIYLSGHGISALWASFTELFDLAKNDPPMEGDDEGVWQFAKRCHLLVIDDFNQGTASSNTFVDLLYGKSEEIIRLRAARGLATLITSNYSLEELANAGWDTLAELIGDNCYSVEVNNANYRLLNWTARDQVKPL